MAKFVVGRHLRGNGIDVLRGHQRQVSGGGNASADVFRRTHLRPVLLAEVERLPVVRADGGQVDVVAGADVGVAGGGDGHRLRVEVAARLHVQRAGIDARHRVRPLVSG